MKTTGIGTFYLFIAGILLNVLFYQSQLFAQNPYLGRYADTVKIGSELNYPPFCMVDEDGEAIGFSVDLFKASAKEVNLKINIKVAQWNVLKEDLAEGHLDALPLVGRSIERDSLFDFTFPYYTMHGAIFVRSDFNEFLTEEDLQGREIGVMEGDNAHDFLIKKGCVNIKTAPTFREVFENLSKGKYDAVVAQKLMGIELLEKLHIENVKPLPFMLKGFNQDFGFAVKNGNSELLSLLNEGLAITVANVTYDSLHRVWWSPKDTDSFTFKERVMLVLPYFIAVVIILVIIMLFLLRHQVKVKTEKLYRANVELENAKKKIEQSERKFRNIFEYSNVGIAIGKGNGDVVDVNEEFANLVEYSREELSEMNISVFTHPDDIEREMVYLQEILDNKRNDYRIEKRYITKSKNTIWIDISVTAVRNDNGQVEMFIGMIYDVTKRKLADEMLLKFSEELMESNEQAEKSRRKYEILISNLQGVVYSCLNDDKYTMKFVSDRVADLTGYSASDFINNTITWAGIIHPEDMQKVIDTVNNAVEIEGSFSMEYRIISADNSVKTVLEQGIVVNYDEEYFLEGYILDISESIKMRNDIILAKEKAEESSRLKTAFLNNLSHEIRTPLNGIMGFSQILQNRKNIEPSKAESYLGVIHKNSQRLLNVIDDVLQISKLETEVYDVDQDEFNILSLLDSLKMTFFKDLEEKALHLNIICEKDLIIISDEQKVFQILSNLIQNAIKFTDKGEISIGCNIRDNIIEFYVKDTGIGIEKEKFDLIFDRFTQVEVGHTRNYEGTGLGLSIAKGLTELLGGKIWCESEFGKGSEFYFTIPLKLADQREVVNKQKEEVEDVLTNKSILIVEDEYFNYMFLKELLESEGALVQYAENGKQAVDLFVKEENFDVVLMDIKMPVMNGLDASKQIKKLKPDQFIIAQTAFSDKEDAIEAKRSGCEEVIIKPVNNEQLLSLILKHNKK